jgi:hypothetical protein
MNKIYIRQEQMGSVSKKMEILRVKRNAEDQKHCNTNEECL